MRSAGAIPIAIDTIRRNHLLDDYNFTFVVKHDECDEALSAGYAVELIRNHSVDVIVGPTCSTPAITNVIENSSISDVNMVYSHRLEDSSSVNIRKIMAASIQRARIFALCFDNDNDRRNFFLAIYDMKLDTDEYLYIMLDTRGYGFGQRATKNITDKNNYQGTIPFYIDQNDPTDGRDDDAMRAARRAIAIDFDMASSVGDLSKFNDMVIDRVFDWPFYCTDCNSSFVASTYARYLFDAMYAYAVCLNKTITDDPNDYRNGTAVADNAPGSFQGASGEVIFNRNGLREAVFVVLGMNLSDHVVRFATIKNDKDGNMTYYSDVINGNAIWSNRGGNAPLDRPVCGFDGKSCPIDVLKSPLAISGMVIGVLLIFFAFLSIIYIIWAKRKEEERLNQQWKIPFGVLVKQIPKKPASQSSRSLTSRSMSVSTKITTDTLPDSEFFDLYYLDRDPVVAAIHNIKIMLTKNDHREMRKLRNLDHSNVNKFLGLCVDTSVYMSIWKYCSRGSLQDVFMKESITMDSFFMYSLMRDILQGLNYIHKSFLEFHGNLTSDNCLVDDRWQVKLSDYGLERLRMAERLPPKKQEVEARTKELESEKKKSDLLLHRMMPKQIAEKLKIGTSVEPESFQSVTVFFSDVVSFTTLAGKSTPLQVVDLLNRLYTNFDHIIDSHDVYKVETIGDGYLCVSGLPHRNGDRHVKEIADMSLAFIASLQTFRIPHIPSETVQIRVGMHTGSVVAGVVGLTMPRYCLFGDTVNTASRMESNSKPNQIHMSGDAHVAIQKFSGYITEPRGDVLIKGKGVMETFWLLGRQDCPNKG
ncbi:hypothetical protein QR680_015188 [Steinernema hermaphroditum]|uniref:Guanylate cyclase n=1 Tax=Steinernema hermaphroditum TaxID=289476 RepID=A0AA39IBF8_9BILA|nr:hypothetical protein QR680_015188 [Steinernema hermaphroditum]